MTDRTVRPAVTSNIQAYVQLTRPQNISGSVITFMIGYFLVLPRQFGAGFFIGVALLLILHSQATLQNDLEDFEIDKANSRQSALQSKRLSLKQTRQLMQVLAGAAVLLVVLSPHALMQLLFVAIALLLAWVYNSQPLQLSKRPIASIVTMGLCFGALPFFYGYWLRAYSLRGYIVIFGTCWLLLRISTAILKDYKDAVGDKRFHKDTFYLHYGPAATARVSFITALIGYLGILIAMVYSQQGIGFIIGLLFVTALAGRSIRARVPLIETKDEKKLSKAFHDIVFKHNQFEAGLLLCLLLPLR